MFCWNTAFRKSSQKTRENKENKADEKTQVSERKLKKMMWFYLARKERSEVKA
jgi:hypothetical protein